MQDLREHDEVVHRPFAHIDARDRRRIRHERTAVNWERAAAIYDQTATVLTAAGDELGAADATRRGGQCRRQAELWWRLAGTASA